MGCSNSKIDREESVARCKARKRLIKQSVSHRHAFAAAHAAYIQSLKNSGAAIRQFAEPEDVQDLSTHTPAFTFPRPELPRPPPLPPVGEDQSSPPRQSLSRAQSLPAFALRSTAASPQKSPPMHPKTVSEEEEDRDYSMRGSQSPSSLHVQEIFDTSELVGFDPLTPERETPELENGGISEEKFERNKEPQTLGHSDERTPEPEPKKVEEKPASEKDNRIPPKDERGKKELGKLLATIDDCLLQCYEAGNEVSRLLEARRLHYNHGQHGIKEHRTKVSHILKSSSKTPLASEHVIYQNDRIESLASTLDKILAWEKKLYDEVKAGEVVRLELEKKSAQLKSQKERGEGAAKIDATKALVKSLQTRYLVEFQAVDSATSEVQKLRDEHLYPQLVDLVKRLKTLWTTMFDWHQKQMPLAANLVALKISSTSDETSDFHRKITEELEREVNNWHQSLENLITTQKEFTTALHGWLHLNIIQIESEVKEPLASPQKMATPPIYDLCKAWMEAAKGISADDALKELKGFSEILHDMVIKQAEEVKQKKKCESLTRDFEKKTMSLETFERKYSEKRERKVSQENQDLIVRTPVQERKVIIDLLKKRLEEEKERHSALCAQNSTKMFMGLKDGLPKVLQSITAFSHECSKAYTRLCVHIETK